MNNELLFYNMYKPLPTDYDIPPTIYSLLNAYVNFGEENKTKISNLAAAGRGMFFDFDYPLTTHITKETFEVMILNNFLMRRIGYDTVTAFKIALNVKLNEIMPKYNKLFDSMIGWDLFNDGETITRNKNNTENSTGSSTGTTSGTGSNISDRRYSDTPQNALSNIRDGRYVTDYNYDTDTSSTNTTASNSTTDNTTGSETEIINRSNANKIDLYKNFSSEINNVYTLIFKELDPLFYGLV